MGGGTTPDLLMQLLSANYFYLLLPTSTYFYLLLPTSTYFYLLLPTRGFALHLTESASTKMDHYFE